MSETPPHVTPSVKTMTLIYIKDQYSSRVKVLTLVENEADADALTALFERTDSRTVELIDVPIWPNIKSEDV